MGEKRERSLRCSLHKANMACLHLTLGRAKGQGEGGWVFFASHDMVYARSLSLSLLRECTNTIYKHLFKKNLNKSTKSWRYFAHTQSNMSCSNNSTVFNNSSFTDHDNLNTLIVTGLLYEITTCKKTDLLFKTLFSIF